MPAATASLSAKVIRAARAAGAAAVAIADAEPDDTARARMAAAFGRGDFSTWGYDEAYARRATDPAVLLPGARSVVCIALPYATRAPASGPLRGRVSNYAWGDDYHVRMREVLTRTAGAIDALCAGSQSLVVCDAAPFAERAFAERAGLGWTGKHTNLIAPGLGSFVFLGEVLTTAALEPGSALRKTCGACTRCVDVCPTGALRGDYTIDATRCISDLTQRKGWIPLSLRPLMGQWVWGCDLCQDACPPSRRAGLRGEARFAASAPRAVPDLLWLLRVRGGEFRRAFGDSAMAWRGAAVLRRNAAIALGNALDRSAIPALASALCSDPSRFVRGHAAWALGRIGAPKARDALAERLAAEPDVAVHGEIEAALPR